MHGVNCHMRIDKTQRDSNRWESELVHMWENGKEVKRKVKGQDME